MAENIITKIGNAEVIEENGQLGLRVHTEIGDIGAYACPDDDYNSLCILFNPIDYEGNSLYEIDISSVTFEDQIDGINIYNYCDPYTEDWTNRYVISRKKIVDALENNN